MIRSFAPLLLVLALAACNTMQGVGKDMSVAGEKLSDTAGEVQRQM